MACDNTLRWKGSCALCVVGFDIWAFGKPGTAA